MRIEEVWKDIPDYEGLYQLLLNNGLSNIPSDFKGRPMQVGLF